MGKRLKGFIAKLGCDGRRAVWLLCALGVSFNFRAMALPGEGNQVVLVYNTRNPHSKQVALHYAERRSVPTNQIIGLDLPMVEAITRAEFRDQLQKPLFAKLEQLKLIQYRFGDATLKPFQDIRESKIRYLVLCYGVPLKITADPTIKEEGMDSVAIELRRNEASVDADLAVTPKLSNGLFYTGPSPNPFLGNTNVAALHPTNGIFLVARLDGPTPEIASALVDKALLAERDGLWGRAYFDTRGLGKESTYKMGDDWIKTAGAMARRGGFEVIHDDKPEVFPATFPLSHVALYAGWYSAGIAGPFARPEVEFMPGAIAYHLHSFNAYSLRTTNQWWAGPLLARGVTATMGSVDEPYLDGTPDVGVWFALTFLGTTFGEAAYASQRWLSWQTTVIGDPLYRPFNRPPQLVHADLVTRKSPMLEWSYLKIVNLNLVTGAKATNLAEYLEHEPISKSSSVLQEKIGDLYYTAGRVFEALRAYQEALSLKMSPDQRMRVLLRTAEISALMSSRTAEALKLYQDFLKEFPDYADRLAIYNRMLPLARDLAQEQTVNQIQAEIERFNTATPAAK